MKLDFAQLYAQLDLAPGCSLEEFKRAYRRRIAEEHPDRPGTGVPEPAQIPLSDLIALYVAATRFHRRHGRLPGALPGRVPATYSAHAAADTKPWHAPLPATSQDEDGAESAYHSTLVIALLLGALLLVQMLWDWRNSDPAPRQASPAHRWTMVESTVRAAGNPPAASAGMQAASEPAPTSHRANDPVPAEPPACPGPDCSAAPTAADPTASVRP